MNAQHAVPCLSVDCWPRHFALTRHNLRYVKGDHTAVMMAIGRDDEHLHILLPRRYTDPDHIFLSPQGPDADNQEVGRVPAISLSSLLAQHPRYADSKLLKLDLEGHEAAVLSGCGDVLQRNHPVIFWEYNYEYVRDAAPSHAAFMQVFAMLRGYGYDQHLFFAATGELICRVGADQTETLQSLSAYLLMARQGWPVPYFDVCSLHRDNAALALPITERALGPKIFTAAYR
jgi:FkbM family methyltransferase